MTFASSPAPGASWLQLLEALDQLRMVSHHWFSHYRSTGCSDANQAHLALHVCDGWRAACLTELTDNQRTIYSQRPTRLNVGLA